MGSGSVIKYFLIIILTIPEIVNANEYVLGPDTDYTQQLEAIFAKVKKDDVIKVKSGRYVITRPMPTIVVPLVFMGDGRAVIKYVGNSPFLTVSARGVEIRDLIILGNGITNGIFAHDNSQLKIENVLLASLKVALEMDYFHDSEIINSRFYDNRIDFLSNKRQITSIKFTGNHFERSKFAIKINSSSTDMVFSNNGFAPIGVNNPIQFTDATFSGSFTGNRFEIKKLATALYFNGQSTKYPVQTMVIQNNYFTGAIKTAIYFGLYTANNTIVNNHFQTNPTISDITNKGVNALINNNNPSVHLDRLLIVN